MNFKKKILSAVILVASVFSMTSCFAVSRYSSASSSPEEKYVTQSDVNKLIEGIEENVTVNAGDNYNININSDGNNNSH